MSIAAISCSPTGPWLGVVGFGFWLTGKLGRAWYRCMVWCMVGLGVSINDVGVLPGWWVCWIGDHGPEHWGVVLDEVW